MSRNVLFVSAFAVMMLVPVSHALGKCPQSMLSPTPLNEGVGCVSWTAPDGLSSHNVSTLPVTPTDPAELVVLPQPYQMPVGKVEVAETDSVKTE